MASCASVCQTGTDSAEGGITMAGDGPALGQGAQDRLILVRWIPVFNNCSSVLTESAF